MSVRLNGWKAIAGYFGRDRTTVMRWASDRDMPIHRLPGGKQSSVFALEEELEEWARSQFVEAEMDDATSEQSNIAVNGFARRYSRWIWLAVIISAGTGAIFLFPNFSAKLQSQIAIENAAIPSDPYIAADYITARDLWARRTAKDLDQSIILYKDVIRRDPKFAPAYAGLADAWLIYREYGDMTEAEAYGNASKAADTALKLDPNLASAHRAKGFIAYWWRYDVKAALAAFRRALSIHPNDGLTHFWYANILSDLGQHKAAQTEYSQAKLLMPGTPAIEVEQACAMWQAGDDGAAVVVLTLLKEKFPKDATVRNCLAWAHISQGDIAGYAGELRVMAAMRKEPMMMKLSNEVDRAIAKDPKTAHLVMIADARREFSSGERHTRMTPAFYASSMGDRQSLLALLNEAVNLGEQWQSVNLMDRIKMRWKGDAEISTRLAKVRAPSPKIAE